MKIKKSLSMLMLFTLAFSSISLSQVKAETNVISIKTNMESIEAKFNKIENANSYNAYIKKEDSNSIYAKLDDQLIFVNSDNVCVNALGLSSGKYYLKLIPIISGLEDESQKIELKDIEVKEEDRSGYAHDNNSNGCGAYNIDGTLRSDADVLYVTEETKNTITYNGKTGLVDILSSTLNKPLAVRIIGDIGAPVFNTIDYKNNVNIENDTVTKISDKIYDITIKDSNGNELSGTKTQKQLIDGGYNTLDDSYLPFTSTNSYGGLISKISSGTKTSKVDGVEYTYNNYDSYFNMIDIKNNNYITVEGVGSNASITQWGLTFKNCNYIEVRNLEFNDYPEDACSFEGSDYNETTLDKLKTGYIWVHHNTFNRGNNNWDVTYEQDKHNGDGATDFKGLKNVTVAYNLYNNNHKTGLVGGDGTHHQANFTFHHNWYRNCQARLPYGRQANMHMYNNFYDSSTGTNMQIHDGGYAFIENCYFKNLNKTFEIKANKTTQIPKIKSYNNIFDNCKYNNIDVNNITQETDYNNLVITDNRLYQMESDNIYDPNFDTNPDYFYYDSKNNKTKVSIMNLASELPELIPNISGAHIFDETTYNMVEGESSDPEEDKPVSYNNYSYVSALNDDFNSSREIIKTTSTPINPGLYYSVFYKESGATTNTYTDMTEYNYININNNSCNISDESSKDSGDKLSATTNCYYIFNENNKYNSSTVTYSLDVNLSIVASKWNIVSFITNGHTLSLYSNADKKFSLRYDDTEYLFNGQSGSYQTGLYNVLLIVDYDNDIITLKCNDLEYTLNNINLSSINGLSFTTSAGSARSYSFTNVNIEVEDNLMLGYQLGKYNENNIEYKAIRIIGKLEYKDIYSNLDSISSIYINIEIVDTNNNKTVLNQKITDVYESLSLNNGYVVCEEETNVRYFYQVIKGITNENVGYTINATSIINLVDGSVVYSTGFSYVIE